MSYDFFFSLKLRRENENEAEKRKVKQNWTFQQHRHHQQCMQGSAKLKKLEFAILTTSYSISQAAGQNKLCDYNVINWKLIKD